jgi:hypothetical protein
MLMQMLLVGGKDHVRGQPVGEEVGTTQTRKVQTGDDETEWCTLLQQYLALKTSQKHKHL